MKKSMFFATIIVVFCSLSSNVLAQDLEGLKGESGYVALKNNWAVPEKGKTVFSQTVSMFLQTNSSVGIGGDFTYQQNGEYVEYAPYLTLNSGPHYALIGLSANNIKGSYVQAGYWNVNKYAEISLVADMRAFIGTNNKSDSFLDNYFEVSYPIKSAIKVGIVAEDVYSLAGDGNTILVGAVAYVDLSKTVKIFGRYLHSWCMSDSTTSQADKFRLGIQYSF